jgi:hypothetical protein
MDREMPKDEERRGPSFCFRNMVDRSNLSDIIYWAIRKNTPSGHVQLRISAEHVGSIASHARRS